MARLTRALTIRLSSARVSGLAPGTLAVFLILSAGAAPGEPDLQARLVRELREDGDVAALPAECRRALCAQPAPTAEGSVPTPKVPEVRPRPARWAAFPAWAAIAFYRSFISPAIGRRCSLTPSCSQYALDAIGRHGLLGVAMFADRAVREPSVVAAAREPAIVNGRRRYPDPLDAHDWWIARRAGATAASPPRSTVTSGSPGP
jgi:hypothetical protein